MEQYHDAPCVNFGCRLGEGWCSYSEKNKNEFFYHKGAHDQFIIPHSWRHRVLPTRHDNRSAGHPVGRRLYQSIRKDTYLPALAVDFNTTARRCLTCAKTRIQLRTQAELLQLFPPWGPLESVAISVFGALVKTARDSHYLFIISNRLTMLTTPTPLKSILAAEIKILFVNEWLVNYRPLKELILTKKNALPQSFSRVFVAYFIFKTRSPRLTIPKLMSE